MSDYEFNYHGLKKTPVGIQVDKYRDLRVQMVNYYEGADRKELFKDVVQGGVRYVATMLNASHGYAVNIGSIVESTAYEVIVDLSSITGSIELIITGCEYLQTPSDYVLRLNPSGQSKTWTNPLISDSWLRSGLAIISTTTSTMRSATVGIFGWILGISYSSRTNMWISFRSTSGSIRSITMAALYQAR